jgi:sialidase-1
MKLNVKTFIKCLILALLFSIKMNSQGTKQLNKELSKDIKTLFTPSEGDYNCFRIPAVVVAKDGSILAFAEARKKSCSDTGNIDIVMKKSTDNGASWSNLIVIWNDGQNVCGNPAPVVDAKTGTVHLLLTWNNGDDHESEIIAQTSGETREVYHLQSSDNGDSWSQPKNITVTTKLKNWTWYATGPVHGIQLKKGPYKGRLMIPSDHIEAGTKKYYSHVIYSDDNGVSWELGGRTPQDQVNECTLVQLENGDLMLNMRNYERKEDQARQVAISKDGGVTWGNQHIDTNLPEPRCQAALLAVMRKRKQVLLFTNPVNPKKRVNMTLSVSRDQGKSWDEKIIIFKGPSAYSDLVELNTNQIFVFFEAGEKNAYEGIHYKLIDLD